MGGQAGRASCPQCCMGCPEREEPNCPLVDARPYHEGLGRNARAAPSTAPGAGGLAAAASTGSVALGSAEYMQTMDTVYLRASRAHFKPESKLEEAEARYRAVLAGCDAELGTPPRAASALRRCKSSASDEEVFGYIDSVVVDPGDNSFQPRHLERFPPTRRRAATAGRLPGGRAEETAAPQRPPQARSVVPAAGEGALLDEAELLYNLSLQGSQGDEDEDEDLMDAAEFFAAARLRLRIRSEKPDCRAHSLGKDDVDLWDQTSGSMSPDSALSAAARFGGA